MLKPPKVQLLISDIHLTPEKPELCQLFENFIQLNAHRAEALYILGDLFDVWLGDDLIGLFEEKIATVLANLAQSGVNVFFVPGNRDFLISQSFAKLAQLKILNDPTKLKIYSKECILCHGDQLCTEDRLYQVYRKIVRSRLCRFLFLKLSRNYRQNIAKRLRDNSKNYQMKQPLSKLDVTQVGVEKVVQRLSSNMIVHGHVHRAKHQQHTVNNQLINRFVLGTWHKTGSVISVQADPFLVQHHEFKLGDQII